MPDIYDAVTTCPICGSARLAGALTIHYWRENPLEFSDCLDCACCFANPMPGDALIARGNDALVKWYHRGRRFEDEFRDARQAYLRGKLLARRLSRWKRRGVLLDLGCYNGFLPLGVRESSEWEAEGVEISSRLAAFVSGRLGLPCHRGTLEELALPENRYDFILCHDLIEHINQPPKFLRELARVLRPGGRLQIITPNGLQDLAYGRRAHRAGYPFTMLLNHILLFSPRSLRVAAEGVGLRVRNLYAYDIRYTAKDLGWFGLGKPVPTRLEDSPSMEEALLLPEKDLLSGWTAERLAELRAHPRVSLRYGFFRETLPKSLTIHLPPALGVGHEIFAELEKPRDLGVKTR